MRTSALLLLSTLLAPTTTAGQQTACAFDTAAATRPLKLAIGLARWWDASGDDKEAELLVAQAIGEHFRAPPSLSLPLAMRVFGKTSGTQQITALGYGLHSAIVFRLDQGGRLAEIIEVSTASQELNLALVSAIRSADSALALRILGWKHDEKTRGRIVLRTAAYQPGEGGTVPLATLVLPIVVADSGPEPIDIPKPVYPPAALNRNRTGWVDLQYIVEENGTAAPGTFHVINGQAEFFDPSIAVLLKGRFRPARIGKCKVPMLVQQRVSYNIGR